MSISWKPAKKVWSPHARPTRSLTFNGEALILPLDVIDRDQCRQVLEAAKVHVGRIDVVINNAGIGFFDAID
jgi:NAD(P)-dependent dehydrogenase (short-subunit alcohol dehydrogenase family)